MTVYLLGFDGASLNTIQESMKRTSLPNFEKLLKNGTSSDLLSVYPYVTAPAWTTIFSGVNPGKHGIFEMFEVRGEKIVPSNMRGTNVPFLWDYLSWAGKRALVVGVPFIYPAPKVNGIFVTGRFAPRLSCYPENLPQSFDFSGFTYDDLSMEEKTEKIVVEGEEKLAERILSDLEKRVRTMMQLVDSDKWDVVILVDGLPDDLLHISYDNDEIVDHMYAQLDRIIGLVMQRMTENDSLLVFSDHGFCKIENVLFLNEWLLKKRFTETHETRVSRFFTWLGIDWNSLSGNGLMSKSLRFFLGHFPGFANRVKTSVRSSLLMDEAEKQRSKVSALSINEPLAWLRIAENHLSEISVAALESELQELKTAGLLKNVFRSDQIYSGKYVSQAPGQILIEGLKGWSMDALRWNKRQLVGKPLLTKKGVHKREGVLLTFGNIAVSGKGTPRVHDLVPTVLDLMNLPRPSNLDGRNLLRKESTPVGVVLNVA